jgi:hypothetical protein
VSSKYMMSINMVGPNLILSTPSSPIFTQLTLLKELKYSNRRTYEQR